MLCKQPQQYPEVLQIQTGTNLTGYHWVGVQHLTHSGITFHGRPTFLVTIFITCSTVTCWQLRPLNHS
jgi:hypothetical protein